MSAYYKFKFYLSQEWSERCKKYSTLITTITEARRIGEPLPGESDITTQTKMFDAIREISSMLSEDKILTPPGSISHELISMATEYSNTRILEMLLSAGAPVLETQGRHNALKIWLMETATTKNKRIQSSSFYSGTTANNVTHDHSVDTKRV